MYVFALVIIVAAIGYFLYLYFFKQDLLFGKVYRKRSKRDRRRKFIASKNQMRRSGKERRQSIKQLNAR